MTGVTGFLGSALAEKLLKERYEVFGIGRKETGFLSDFSLNHPNFRLLKLDLAECENTNIEQFKIDAVVHLASQQPSASDLVWDDYVKGNVDTTRRLLQDISGSPVRQFIYASTTSVIGRPQRGGEISELSAPSPMGYYGLSKYVAERLVEIDLSSSAAKGVVIRFPSIFGRNHRGGIVHTYYTLAREDKPIEVYGRGERYRNLLYVDDAVRIIMKSLESNDHLSAYELFTAGSSNSKKMLEIATCIKNALQSQSPIVPVGESLPNDGDIVIDISKIREKLGVVPMTIEEGLSKYLEEMNREI